MFLLAKFGEKKHLEALKDGSLHFSAVKIYRNDGTDYCGDSMEGAIPINPHTIKMYDADGNNLFDNIPYPTSVSEFIQEDDSLLMFCASVITMKVLIEQESGIYTLSNEFKEAVKNFGDYVLVFWSCDLSSQLHGTQKNYRPKFGFESGKMLYRDLSDYSSDGSYCTAYNTTGRFTDRYFVKDLKYANQNEWRIILDGTDESLPINDNGGYDIPIGKLTSSMVISRDTFFNTFQYTKND